MKEEAMLACFQVYLRDYLFEFYVTIYIMLRSVEVP